MPWKPSEASVHTKKARSAKRKRQWAKIANAALRRYGDEGRAIRIASGVIRRQKGGTIVHRGRKRGRKHVSKHVLKHARKR